MTIDSDFITQRKLRLADPWYQLILRMIKSHVFGDLNSKTILEVGCGKGVFSSRMAKTYKFVVGLDISLSSIRTAKKLAKKLGSSEHVDFIIGDAQFLHSETVHFS